MEHQAVWGYVNIADAADKAQAAEVDIVFEQEEIRFLTLGPNPDDQLA